MTLISIRTLRAAQPQVLRRTLISSRRPLSTTPTRWQQDKKDDLMDKDSINTTSTEYSKSGGDQQASQSDEAFNPDTTSPEEQHENQQAKSGSENAQEVSPGNPDVSRANDGDEKGNVSRSPNESGGERRQASGGGSPRKGGGGKSG